MRKKLYFVLCMATCLMFATACNKNNSEELTTSAYKDTVSDMEKTTEATEASSDASSNASSEDDKKTTEKKDDEASSESTTKSDDSKTTSSSNSSTESNSTTASSTESSSTTASDDEDITAEGDENFEEPTTASKDSEKETWASSGTLSGFIDSDSVEIIMSDGSTRTFFVYDEDIANQLEELLNSGEETSIDFVSRPIAGQANSQIIELK